MNGFAIRAATEGDLPALTNLYNHYIAHTPITFDTEPWTLVARHEWFSHYAESGRHRLLVAEGADGAVLGYASSSKFRPKAAYDTSVEASVYVAESAQRRGVGTMLYAALFAILETEDVHRAVAGVTLPNEKSLALHEKFGFRQVGVMTEVGRKFDKYWDVAWLEKDLHLKPAKMIAFYDPEKRLFIAAITEEIHSLKEVKWTMFTHGVHTNCDSNSHLKFNGIAIAQDRLSFEDTKLSLEERLAQAIHRLRIGNYMTHREIKLALCLEFNREQIITQWLSSYPKS